MKRLTASRTSVAVEVGPPGSRQMVTVKVADTTDGLAGFGTATAELAEAEAAARALGWPVRAVCEAAVAQYRAQATVPRLLELSGIRLGGEVRPRQRTVVPSGRYNSDSSARVGSPSQSPFLAMAKAAVVVARSRESAVPAPSR